MTNATPLVLPAQQQSQAFMHKWNLCKRTEETGRKTQKVFLLLKRSTYFQFFFSLSLQQPSLFFAK